MASCDIPWLRVCRMALLTVLMPMLLAFSAHALLEVQVSEVPVVALHGQDVILNCSFFPAEPFNLSALVILWQRTVAARLVHGYRNGVDQPSDQDERFINRTRLFHAELASGNASLVLRNVGVGDEGFYTCFVSIQEFGGAAVLMEVAAPYSKPQVTSELDTNLRPGDQVSLICVAHGGYPEAEVTWLDEAGHNLTDNVTVSQVANEDGLFSVRSVLTVTVEPDSTYNCTLFNPLLWDRGWTFASITALSVSGLSPAFPPVALWVTVGLSVCLLSLLIALGVICGRKLREELAKEREGKALEEDECKTAMKPLKS